MQGKRFVFKLKYVPMVQNSLVTLRVSNAVMTVQRRKRKTCRQNENKIPNPLWFCTKEGPTLQSTPTQRFIGFTVQKT